MKKGPGGKAKASKKAAEQSTANAGPKSPEVLELEAKIAAQGNVVRSLKAQPKTDETEASIKAEVDVLKKLKAELAAAASS